MTADEDDIVIREVHDAAVETHEGMRLPSDLRSSPGEILLEELEARGMSVAVFIGVSGLAPETVAKILAGTHSITPEIADRIATVLGTSAAMWISLDRGYRA